MPRPQPAVTTIITPGGGLPPPATRPAAVSTSRGDLPPGADGTTLTADSTTDTGMAWKPSPAAIFVTFYGG